jgi:hypothetical protein
MYYRQVNGLITEWEREREDELRMNGLMNASFSFRISNHSSAAAGLKNVTIRI